MTKQDFAPLPTYQETRNSNPAWVQSVSDKRPKRMVRELRR
jgi:hypothetical protein